MRVAEKTCGAVGRLLANLELGHLMSFSDQCSDCDFKEAEQTVHHILQDRPIWRKQRHQLWPQDESTTNKLWGTAEDLRRTTQFLATCGLRF